MRPVLIDDDLRMSPCTSYPFSNRSSARYEPSWPVIPVIRARGRSGISRSLSIEPGQLESCRVSPAGERQSGEQPELESKVVLKVRHIDEPVDENGHRGQQHTQVNWPPIGSASAPASPTDHCYHHENGREREHAQQPCFRPEVQQ